MKKTKPMHERRQSVRFRVLSLVKHATEPHVVTFQVTNIQDVSRGGLAFFAEQEIKGGEIVRLCFLPPNREKPIEARGKVVRCPPGVKNKKIFKVGIQFLDIPEDAKLSIQELEALFLESQKNIQS